MVRLGSSTPRRGIMESVGVGMCVQSPSSHANSAMLPRIQGNVHRDGLHRCCANGCWAQEGSAHIRDCSDKSYPTKTPKPLLTWNRATNVMACTKQRGPVLCCAESCDRAVGWSGQLQLNALGTLGLFPSAMSAKPAHSKRKSQVVAMTGDCIGELEDPPNCANDIFGFMATLTEW